MRWKEVRTTNRDTTQGYLNMRGGPIWQIITDPWFQVGKKATPPASNAFWSTEKIDFMIKYAPYYTFKEVAKCLKTNYAVVLHMYNLLVERHVVKAKANGGKSLEFKKKRPCLPESFQS